MKFDIFQEFPEISTSGRTEYIVVTPILRLEITEKVSLGKFKIFPKGTLNFDDLTSNNFSDKIEENRLLFNTNTLLVHKQNIDISKPHSQIHDKKFISESFQESEKILNYIKFFYCKYFDSATLIANSGQREDGKNVIFVFHEKGSPFTGIKENDFLTHKITKGIGLRIQDLSLLKNSTFFDSELDEVGNILIHALELNSAVLNANTNTQKFILSMNLIEYLGFPNSYEQFKKVKSKIICHNTDNIGDYHKLAKRFEELTGGTENKDGEKIIGLRTNILHIGKKIEQIIPDEKEINNLLKELQGYIYHTMIDMFQFANKKWEELEQFREKKWESIQKKKQGEKKKDTYADKLIIIDLSFLDSEAKRWLKFYQDLYPAKNLSKIYIENLIIQTCVQSRIKESDEILSIFLILDENSDYSFAEKVVKLKAKEFFSFDIGGVYKFDVQIVKVKSNEDRYNYITKFLDAVSREGNTFTDKIGGKVNEYYICIDNKELFDFFDKFRKRKHLQLIRLSGWETELSLEDVLYVDVGHVIGLGMGLEIHEL